MELKSEILSWRKFIHGLYPNVPIFEERDIGKFERPSFRIEEAGHGAVEFGIKHSNWLDERVMALIYFAESLQGLYNVQDTIVERLKRDKYIKSYFHDLHYLKPTIYPIEDENSSIGGQTVYVSVSAIVGNDGNVRDPLDNSVFIRQTLLSEEIRVEVEAGKGLKLMIIPYPLAIPYFNKYNV